MNLLRSHLFGAFDACHTEDLESIKPFPSIQDLHGEIEDCELGPLPYSLCYLSIRGLLANFERQDPVSVWCHGRKNHQGVLKFWEKKVQGWLPGGSTSIFICLVSWAACFQSPHIPNRVGPTWDKQEGEKPWGADARSARERKKDCVSHLPPAALWEETVSSQKTSPILVILPSSWVLF